MTALLPELATNLILVFIKILGLKTPERERFLEGLTLAEFLMTEFTIGTKVLYSILFQKPFLTLRHKML